MRSKYILRPVLVILLSFTSLNIMAQSLEQQKTDSVFQLVKTQFNAKQADSIYALTSDAFKRNVSAETFNDVANNQLFHLGEIKHSSLISFVNNKIATYKLVFDSMTLQLLISVDEYSKMDYFRFQPYTKPEGVKPALVATSNPLKSATDKIVDTAARPYIQKANTVGLSIGVISNGKISTYNYGETTRGNNLLPTANTIFEIGSITKTFTATLLAYYVNEGKIKLTDTITKYLPDSVAANPALQNITVVTLSNHTSGLPSLPDNFYSHPNDTLNPYKNYDSQLMFAYLKTCKLNTQPGEKYAYSNLAVGLLGTILERVSGKTFDQMVTEIITKPLKITSTMQHVSPVLRARFAAVYNETGKSTLPWNFDVLAPCGSLRSTVNNLLVYVKANMDTASSDTTPLHKAFLLTHQITFNKGIKLGLNWHVIVVNGIEYYFHDGDTYGSSSFLAFNIEKNVAVIILSNCGEGVNDIGVNILKRLE